jgi:pyrophosphate--fructose-6-phosphate 1-phosphotransferase
MLEEISPLQKARLSFKPTVPSVLASPQAVHCSPGKIAVPPAEISVAFPHTANKPILTLSPGASAASQPLRVGVVFSGGQAPGGHNVVAALFDTLKTLHANSQLFGFLGGPSGIVKNSHRELKKGEIDAVRNTGGFDLLGSGRTKIETDEQLAVSLQTVAALKLDGLVIIGGDDSNTNAAVLAEYFLAHQCQTCVIGVPKTIDGDLQNEHLPISFGFDTACRVYSEMIGNIARDALSAKKYTHFIKLMGRSASHIALECALATRPNVTLISEEIAAQKWTLKEVTHHIADTICKRAEAGMDYSIILIPEGLIEFLPADMSAFPEAIQKQLQAERDPHGNINVSLVATELLLIETVSKELEARTKAGTYKGKFAPLAHFFGYEGRAAFPSNFDCTFCTALGTTAALLINARQTSYMVCIPNLSHPPADWKPIALPLTSLLHFEMRKGVRKPVIQKALVDLKGAPFTTFKASRATWATSNHYRFPGPLQFAGSDCIAPTIVDR